MKGICYGNVGANRMHLGTTWCTDCDVAVPDIKSGDDLVSITIEFGDELQLLGVVSQYVPL